VPDFRLPDLGEGVTEAEVDRWLVKEGDTIAEDEPLVEVITDKATAEIPSPFAGVVSKIHVQAGEVAAVGAVLVSIGDEADGSSAPEEARAPASTTAERLSADGAFAGDLDGADGQVADPGPADEAGEAFAPRAGDLVGTLAPAAPGQVKAMPPVRRLARELGVEITSVEGTGPGGRVLRSDVESYAARGETAEAGSRSERRVPLRGVRRTIAQRMSHAHRIVPPVTHVEECDVTELDATRKLVNDRDAGGTRLTYLPFIVMAVTRCLREHPSLNASLHEGAGEIVFHEHRHIGVAVDTPEGLVVPVIRHADTKDLRSLAREIDDLATRARSGTLTSEDLRGGTFTVTSPGAFGGLMATPIILHPQTGILGVHRAIERPVVRDHQIAVRKIMNLSITFDHRVLDGMTAARFALGVAQLLEHPALLAIEG
jgi:pyruvate/2-oxoglutarate dehydrogenase complex dihydrolipoamide acyltransferase (E2) component